MGLLLNPAQHWTGIFKPLTKTSRDTIKLSWITEPCLGRSANAMRCSLQKAPPAAGSTTATHGGQDTALADPAASYLWLCTVCSSTMAKTGRLKDKNHIEHQTDALKTGSECCSLILHILCILERKWKWKGWQNNPVYLYPYHSRLTMPWQEILKHGN